MNARTLFQTLCITSLVLLAGCSMPNHPTTPAQRSQAAAKSSTREPAALADKGANDGTVRVRLQPISAPPPPPSVPTAVMAPAEQAASPSGGLRSMAVANQARAAYIGPLPYPTYPLQVDREHYAHYDDNPVQVTAEHPVSTFGIDVDTGSYTNVRRMIEQGQLPPADAVRAEEFINYFDYGYAPPSDRETPFSVTTEVAPAPWNHDRQLLLVGIQGYRVPVDRIPAVNLVFLVDTSGSMDEPDKLPLLKASLKLLVPKLRHRDRVAIVTYAGSAGVALPSTPGDEHARILAAIDAMQPGGSTNGQAGIELAYTLAQQGFIEGGVNRVLLATDGDFNVGQTGIQALTDEIKDKRRSGIALSTLGFGSGNYNDAMAVRLADVGNGNHHYIDSLDEGRRVLVDEMSQTLLTIAKDVKIQIEFNPARVREYRLIGYVKRKLRREDFNNDQVDSGEIGAGANVTALYEITPVGSPAVHDDPLRYATPQAGGTGKRDELAWLRLRYKLPGHAHSRLIQRPVTDADVHARASTRLRFAAAVAAFADQLRGGTNLDGYTLDAIARLARNARGSDPDGYRAGFVRLVELAEALETPRTAGTPMPPSGDAPMIRR